MITQLEKRQSLIARAFNHGSDARIAGRPSSANPYHGYRGERDAWNDGWKDADLWWGADARLVVKELPAVEGRSEAS